MQKLIAALIFIPFLGLSILLAVTMGSCFKNPAFPGDLVKMVKAYFPDKTTQKIVTIHIPFHDSPGVELPVQKALEATGVTPSPNPTPIERESPPMEMPSAAPPCR